MGSILKSVSSVWQHYYELDKDYMRGAATKERCVQFTLMVAFCIILRR